MHFDEDKFTAYALGELDASELGPVEARLRYDEAARQFVDDVRAAAALLTQSLAAQCDQTLTDLQHAAIERQLRANRAASTGHSATTSDLAAALALTSSTPINPEPQVDLSLIAQASVSDKAASRATAQRVMGSLGRNNRSIFMRRAASRYDRAVLALSLAASVAIVCLGLAALLPALRKQPTVAVNPPAVDPQNTPYIVQGQATPPDQRFLPVPPLAQILPPHELRVWTPETNDIAPWLSSLALARPPQVDENPTSTDIPADPVVIGPVVDVNVAPVPSVHLVRKGLVRGPSDVPRPVNPVAPVQSTVPHYTSVSQSPNVRLQLTVPPTQIDPSLDVTRFENFSDNPLVTTSQQPFSSFAPTSDSASYVLTRRFLAHGYFPPPQAVRVEEMLNYFPWKVPAPATPDDAFSSSIEVGVCPWNVDHRLARVVLKARDLQAGRRPPVNLVFLVDLSAQMRADNKLPLLKKSMKLLLNQLGSRDHLSIVGASQNSWFFLPPTAGNDRRTIQAAIDRLQASGPAGSAPGIEAAYYAAAGGFTPGGVNRVLLATDGTWNAALSDPSAITRIVEEKSRTQNISLGVLAMGGTSAGTDAALRRFAAAGNGSYLAIDSVAEAHKTLFDEVDGSLIEVARDVSVRVEFDPAATDAYRLIGYESHLLPAADFDDAVVGGASVGAGHQMTAIYEIVPTPASRRPDAAESPLLTLSVRYTDPATQASSLLKFSASDRPVTASKMSNDFKFAAAVAEFATLLRDSAPHANVNWGTVLDLAQQGRGPDESHYREEFIELVKHARTLATRG